VGREEGTLQYGIVEPHGNHKPKEEFDMQVETQGGIKKKMDLEHGESLSHNIEGKIRKVAQTPPKFDVVQQKKFLCKKKWL
jgi:hypothetical protein